jgi:hypothetical protein
MLHEASKDVISLLCINNELSYEVSTLLPSTAPGYPCALSAEGAPWDQCFT